MKSRLIQVGFVIVLICCFAIFMHFQGAPISKPTDKPQDDEPIIYTAKQITDIFKKHNLKLTEVQDPDDLEKLTLHHVPPKIYTINHDNEHRLFIYVFDNAAKRKVAKESISAFHNNFISIYYVVPNAVPGIYETWNALLVEVGTKSTSHSKVSKIVFKALNKGKVQKYVGESDHWKGTYTLNYYTHYWMNEEGMDDYDRYGQGNFLIHFKPKDHDQIGEFQYEFRDGSTRGTMSGETLDEKGNFMIQKSNVDKADSDSKLTMTIKWSGKEETLHFKAQK